MKTKITTLFVAVVFAAGVKAQNTLAPTLVGAAGNYVEGTYTWLAYSVGEPVVTTGTGNTTILTQGFQQPTENFEGEIYIYSGFTPNGDGDNDTWYIDHITAFPDNTVTIFDRWGVIVWKADGYNNKDVAWKGDNNVSGKVLSNGTYFYIVKINDKTYKGWVELSR